MTPSPRLLQLYAIRAQIEALVAAEEVEMFSAPVECPHPEDKRVDASNLQETKFLCRACGKTVDGVA